MNIDGRKKEIEREREIQKTGERSTSSFCVGCSVHSIQIDDF